MELKKGSDRFLCLGGSQHLEEDLKRVSTGPSASGKMRPEWNLKRALLPVPLSPCHAS